MAITINVTQASIYLTMNIMSITIIAIGTALDIAFMTIGSYLAKMNGGPSCHHRQIRLVRVELTVNTTWTNGADACSWRHANSSEGTTFADKLTDLMYPSLAQRRPSVRAGNKSSTEICVGTQNRSIARGHDCVKAPTKNRTLD